MPNAVRYIVQLALGCVVTAAASFMLVRYLLSGPEPAPPNTAHRHEAEQLRRFSNELLRLRSEFFAQATQPSATPAKGFEHWVSRSFGPKVNGFRRRMLGTGLSGEAFSALLAAADRVAAMAATPGDARIRRMASNAVLAATGEAETRIAELGLQQEVSPPPLVPGYRRQREP